MNAPIFDTLELQFTGQVATVNLNRPDKANSMNATLWSELQSCFEWLDQESAVRAVILAGNGKHFCAGIDLAMFGGLHGGSTEPSRRAEYLRRTILRLQGNLTAVESCRKPVLAAIHNTCIGGGVDLVCCADMRYSTRDAFFSIREIDIGMTADVGTLQRLPKLIADGVVRELAYTGRNLSAQEASELGFVNRVYEDRETLLREVMVIAQSIAAKSPLAVRGSKEALLYSRDHSVSDSLNFIATWNSGMLSEADVQAGLQAQLEKRPANYED
jgi:enoyl-CoA hydratase